MQRRMLSMIAAAGTGLALAALAATPSYASTTYASTTAGAPTAGGSAAAAACRVLDFEKAAVSPLAVTGTVPPTTRYRLTVTGTRPSTNVAVRLVPLVYVRQPAYWGIQVIGCSSGIGLPVLTTYTVTLDFTGAMGTCGVDVVGSGRHQQFDLAGCTRTSLAGTRWTLDPASLDVPVPAGKAVTANFSDTAMSGNTSCNAYTTSYTAGAAGSLKLGPIAMTPMLCDPASSASESAFLKRLGSVTGYVVTAKELQLLASGTTVLRFTPTVPAA